MLENTGRHLTTDNSFYLPQFPVADLLRVEVFYSWRATEAAQNVTTTLKMCQRGLKLVLKQHS